MRLLSAMRLPPAMSLLTAMAALTLLSACDDMSDQAKQRPYSPGAGPAPIPAGVVQYGERPGAAPALTPALLERGQERFRIYCTPCHSELGDGQGMIVQRGFPPPPSYHDERLRGAPTQHFYDVITQGYGAMYPFADRVPSDDRWAIAAYIRALQRSQNATLTQVPPADRGALR
jgi:mono/diheme cytochrome c family protein